MVNEVLYDGPVPELNINNALAPVAFRFSWRCGGLFFFCPCRLVHGIILECLAASEYLFFCVYKDIVRPCCV